MKYLRLVLLMLMAVARVVADEEVNCRNLQVHFDVAKLEAELQLVAADFVPRHAHGENWTAIPLRNASGTKEQRGLELHHSIQHKTMLPCKNSEFLEKLPYIASILEDIANMFDTEVGLVRLSKVPSLKSIRPHTDGEAFDLRRGKIHRLHLPIITGENVIFEIGGISFQLEPGTLYYTNVAKTHAVYNNGSTDRIHLIIDVHSTPTMQAAILSAPECSKSL